MAQEELEIEINAQGMVTVRTKGIKGEACMDLADFVAKLVGQEQSRVKTAEYYETETEVARQTHIQQRR